MMETLRLKNYKSHTNTEIQGLGPLCAFVGPNGVGKSSALDAAYVLHRLGAEAPRDLLAEPTGRAPDNVARKGSDGFVLDASGRFDGHRYRAKIVGALPLTGWKLTNSSEQDGRTLALDSPEAAPLRAALTIAHFFRFEPSQLRRASYSEALAPSLETNGLGLASVVAYLMCTAPEGHRELVHHMQNVIPSVRGVRARPAYVPNPASKVSWTGHEILFDTVDGEGIPATGASEGTLTVLAILTVATVAGGDALILLDDVETGLHPKAQRDLIAALRKLTEDNPGLQILMSTHSPYIVDELKPEEVWVFDRDEHKKVGVRRLSELPNADEALKVLTTGELWSMATEGKLP
ncbi:MAG: AAA family ATPase [Polyangiaceae bacterium]|nr:AAA family ATPase [Polyangiaceae bacterium]MBK8941367.1 AAA family ATPase [Polyangiaceae bacterium]